MTFLEKQTDPTSFMHWRGDMQADYMYTNGVAGNRFFQHLKKKNTFLASRCPKCKKVYLPPRIFCEDCFCDIPDRGWHEVPAKGTIRLWTVATLNAHGEKLAAPQVIAFIDIDKTDSSMLGIVKTKNLDKDLFGQKVKAVLRPKSKREGTLKDILYFE
jgi:uncharacterized OB-fold protein